MLRVKVQSCRWECLLCLRTFASKFCYLLHCKNVHGKSEAKNVDDAVIRPTKRFSGAAAKQRERRYGTRSLDSLRCSVCNKPYTNRTRLLQHKRLHLKKDKNGLPEKELDDSLDPKVQDSESKRQDDLCEIENIPNEEDNQELKDGTTNEAARKPTRKKGRPRKQRPEDQIKEPVSTDKISTTGDAEVQQEVEEKTLSEEPSDDTAKTTKSTKKRKRGRPRKDRSPENVNISRPTDVFVTGDSLQGNKAEITPAERTPASAPKKPRGQKRLSRECTVCNKVFANRSSLREHNRLHTGEKPYTCSVCEKGFIRMGHLKQHMCSHTGLWPFKCGACGKGFMNPSRVSRHMRVHSDERPFVCDSCGEGFKEPHHLTRHFFVHTGEKPFRCPMCEDRFFIQPGNLKIHMKTHEKDIVDASGIVGDVSHEVVASTGQITDVRIDCEQQTALEGLAAISAYRKEASDSTQDTLGNIENEHGYSEAGKESSDSRTEQSITNQIAEKNAQKGEILLQFMPNLAPSMHIQGFQELSSIDQEFLRQFASSVAHELVNSQ